MKKQGWVLAIVFISSWCWGQVSDSTQISLPDSAAPDSPSFLEDVLGVESDPDSGQILAPDTAMVAVPDSVDSLAAANPDSSLPGLVAGSDSLAIDSTTASADTARTEETALAKESGSQTANPEPDSLNLSLDFGYKGYAWGSRPDQFPPVHALSGPDYTPDSTVVSYRTVYGADTVQLHYFYADSGFWKVEISYAVHPFDSEANHKKFLELLEIISGIYGNPSSKMSAEEGPLGFTTHPLDIGFYRTFEHASWYAEPCQIELVHVSNVQDLETPYPIISNLSRLVLVYYHPDFMIKAHPEKPVDTGPSIYDFY
ncbi:MAG: hypothetical protein D6762_01195 [Candidatus Neomarinimicrobiota bacterium]|nr:MAG: hypothetical protein D6762_01195 [Candidatus Neomarinimicrobiota bacterium]